MSETQISRTLSRRKLVGASLTAGAGAALISAGASAQGATPVATPTEAGWTYTDILGREISLPAVPSRISAQIGVAGSLWDFGVQVQSVFGWTAATFPDGDHVAWGSVDPAQVELVSHSDTTLNVEALIVQEPDLIVTWCWDRALGLEALADLDFGMLEQLEQIAPVLVLRQGDANEVELGLFEAFVESLGVDLEGEELVAVRETYASRKTEVQAIAQAKPDITVLFGSFGEPEAIYIASPDHVADVGQLRDLGVNIANDGSETATSYWENLSYEQALLYTSDVLFVDHYGSATTIEALRELPTISRHPAVEAGQVGLWRRDLPISYQGLTQFLDDVLGLLRVAEKVS